MRDKIIEFLDYYLNGLKNAVEKYSKEYVIKSGLSIMINSKIFTEDELRKKLSENIQRIISIDEFELMLKGEYVKTLYEE